MNSNAPTTDPPARPAPPPAPLGERVQSLSLSRLPERRSTLLPKIAWSASIGAVVVLAWLAYWSYWRQGASDTAVADAATSAEPDAKGAANAQRAAPAGARPSAQPAAGDVVLEAKGYIVPAHQILVSPKVSGMIVSLDIEEGRRVTKGDVLAVLESTDYEADSQRAKATVQLARERLRELENGNRPEEIQQAEAELREAEAQLSQLEADFKRTKGLLERSSISEQEFELAQSKFLSQKQRIAALGSALALMKQGPRAERIAMARAELAQSEADLTKAQWRLGNCTIRAPISGTILKKNAEEGNIVNPIAFNGSFSLCEMADLSDLEVDLNIQERDIAVVQTGLPCRIRAEAYPSRVYEGHVDRLMPIADRAKGAIPVRVKVKIPADEEGIYLKPEMGAIVTFLAKADAAAGLAQDAKDAAPISAAPISAAP